MKNFFRNQKGTPGVAVPDVPFFHGYLSRLDAVKPFADDLAGIGNEDERTGLHLLDILPELHSLIPLENRKDNVFLIMGEGAFRFTDGGAAAKLMHNVVADGLRAATNHIEIFAQVDALNHVVNHQGFGEQSQHREQECFNIENEERG